jgi:hypothetical protein
MPQMDPNAPPESIVLGAFGGIKNTVSRERLEASDLERATNIDLDDAGQPHRRRGFALASFGSWHSVRDIGGRTYGVRDGTLGIIDHDYSFIEFDDGYTDLVAAGTEPLSYTEVAGDVYFSSASTSGIISGTTILGWGHTGEQGTWLSPVLQPTDTLGEVSGRLLGDPPRATSIEAYKGRIYLAVGKILWATELYTYHYVDRTRNFMQFEHDITLLMAMDDGIYVGTTGGLYFIGGMFGQFKLSLVIPAAVLPGSGVFAPVEQVHPQARNGPLPTGVAALMMTSDGIVAGFDGGSAYNLTHDRVIFPDGISAAGLFRQDLGVSSYVAAVDSAGGPSANTRIGDYVDAEIVRFRGA